MNDLILQLARTLVCPGGVPSTDDELRAMNVPESYRRFCVQCNGGYSEDFFFHFFGRSGPREHNIYDWNQTTLWKHCFSLDDTSFVFAENIFGTQFFFDVRGNRKVVKMLCPESGQVNLCANSLEEFIEGEVFGTEFNHAPKQLAKAFFLTNPPREYTHISLKIPKLLGGNANDINNLEVADSLMNLSFLGQIFTQVKVLPPGTRINRVNVK